MGTSYRNVETLICRFDGYLHQQRDSAVSRWSANQRTPGCWCARPALIVHARPQVPVPRYIASALVLRAIADGQHPAAPAADHRHLAQHAMQHRHQRRRVVERDEGGRLLWARHREGVEFAQVDTLLARRPILLVRRAGRRPDALVLVAHRRQVLGRHAVREYDEAVLQEEVGRLVRILRGEVAERALLPRAQHVDHRLVLRGRAKVLRGRSLEHRAAQLREAFLSHRAALVLPHHGQLRHPRARRHLGAQVAPERAEPAMCAER